MNVGEWLRRLDFGRYEVAFEGNAVDARVLRELTADDLKSMGVARVGHRRDLLAAIVALSDSPGQDLPTAPSEQPPSPSESDRRHVSVLFCDVANPTGLPAGNWRDLIGPSLADAATMIAQMGGHVAKAPGNGVMALFGYPVLQENDAERAVRAALFILRGLGELNRANARLGRLEISARIGVDCGVVIFDRKGEASGDPLHIAARLQSLADPGSVLVTSRVQSQLSDLFISEDCGPHALRGVRTPTRLFRILRPSGGGRRSRRKTLTPLVDRTQELRELIARAERARQGEGQFITVVGEPGIGKSRLLDEFHDLMRETPHTWIEWNASPLLQNTPMHPIGEWGRLRFGGEAVADDERLLELDGALAQLDLDPLKLTPLLAPIVDVKLPDARVSTLPPDELRRRQIAAIVDWIAAGARRQLVVLAIEDLQWADPSTLEVVGALAERGAGAALLVVATARPEFRAPWPQQPHHLPIGLAALDHAHVSQMVSDIAARFVLSREALDGVAERTGGVPLYVEEVTRLFLEHGGPDGDLPHTRRQSLAARLDRIGPDRDVARVASVIGREFSYSLLSAVAELDVAALGDALDRLADADILIVDGRPPDADYRFKHALIQDGAYDTLSRARRSALHRRVAEALRDRFPARAEAEPEAVAHHFTLAGLVESALEWWDKAGDQAMRRSAFKEAAAHLGKAIEMADRVDGASRRDPQRLKRQAEYGKAVAWLRGFGAEEAKVAFARAQASTAEFGDPAARAAAQYGVWVNQLVRSEMAGARETAEAFVAETESGGPSARLATAHRVLGMTAWLQGDFAVSRRHLERSIAMSDPEREREGRRTFGQDTAIVASTYLAQTLWHIGEAAAARRLTGEALAKAAEAGHLPTEVNAVDMAAILAVTRGDVEAARPLAARMGALAAEPKLPLYSASAALILSWCDAGAVGPVIASGRMRQALSDYRRPGTKILLPFYLGRLAEIEAVNPNDAGALARLDEALAYAQASGEAWSDSLLHRIRGDILRKTNPLARAPAEAAYRAALEVARAQGARSFELQAALRLAEVLVQTGSGEAARETVGRAASGLSRSGLPEYEAAQRWLENAKDDSATMLI